MPHTKKAKPDARLAELPFFPPMPTHVISASNIPLMQDIPWHSRILLEKATAMYPQLESSEALNTFLCNRLGMAESNLRSRNCHYPGQGVFFENENGERCVWREDINLSRSNCFGIPYISAWVDRQGRNYVVPNTKNGMISRKHADRPRSRVVTNLAKHTSEDGWNLPENHPRHLFNFPRDIMVHILRFVVGVPPTQCVIPFMVSCNWKQDFSPVHFGLQYKNFPKSKIDPLQREKCYPRPADSTRSLVLFKKSDNFGPYTECRIVIKPTIDASFLRSGNKQVQVLGEEILYGNTFRFPMPDPSWTGSPPSVLRGRMYRPWPFKPDFNETDLATLIKCIEKRHVYTNSLPGWAYYDPFLRFIFTIKARNASNITHLIFEGTAKKHNCNDHWDSRNGDDNFCNIDLLLSLQYYIPIIIRFCPELTRLTLIANVDRRIPKRGYGKNHHDDEEYWTGAFEEAVGGLLEDEVRRIPKLRELRVIKDGYLDDDVSFARPTIDWLAARGARQESQEMQAKLGEKYIIYG